MILFVHSLSVRSLISSFLGSVPGEGDQEDSDRETLPSTSKHECVKRNPLLGKRIHPSNRRAAHLLYPPSPLPFPSVAPHHVQHVWPVPRRSARARYRGWSLGMPKCRHFVGVVQTAEREIKNRLYLRQNKSWRLSAWDP